MKLLIAARGAQPDSLLAKVADTPVYYLVVDMTTSTLNVLNPMGRPHIQFIASALAEGVEVLIAESDDSHTRIKTFVGLTTVSLSGERTVEEAIRRWKNGELNSSQDPPRETSKAGTLGRSLRRGIARAQSRLRGARTAGRNPTPRGRHHLQQYAGRGH